MPGFNSLVLEEQRHLKWRALDWLEQVLMILCGVAITGFSVLVMCDIVTRTIGHPWLWLQEATMTFFIYGIFIGVGAATRRNDHLYLAVLAESMTGNKRLFFEMFNRLVVLGVAVCMIYFGYLNFLDGFKSLRMPSMTPLSSLYAAIPLCGVLIAIFTIEQMVNGWKNGFAGTSDADEKRKVAVTANGGLIFLMGFLFLFLGYMGVPVAFALIASVLVVTAFTPVSLASMMAQLFNGMDTEALLAMPFFLLVGDLMTSANVTVRMITLSQTMVGHLRGGLAQVVTIFSMFFAGISGSSAADVAILSRTLAPEMKREGYDLAFTAALIASASTMANLIPPSIMAVVYGATGNVSIGGLFLGGVVPGVFVGIGLMIYSYFFGPVGIMRPRATFGAVHARPPSKPRSR